MEQSRELIPVERVMQSRRRILSQASRGRLRNQHCNSKHLQSCIFRSQTLMAMRPLYKEADSYQNVALVSIRPVECSRTRALDWGLFCYTCLCIWERNYDTNDAHSIYILRGWKTQVGRALCKTLPEAVQWEDKEWKPGRVCWQLDCHCRQRAKSFICSLI